jgi:hypothetical protein
MISESTCVLGRTQHLVATVTLPSAHVQRAPWMLLLTNSGVIPRSGPHRMNVHLARTLAKHGVASIRFDMSGLGDSLRAGGAANVTAQWVADTRDVMDYAQQHFGCGRFAMIGFCSGAEVAYKTALQDTRLAAAVLWDLYAYQTLQSQLRTFAYRLKRAGALGAAQKLLAKLGIHKPNTPATASARPQIFEPAKIPSAQEYAQDLLALAQRGMALIVLQCGGEPEWYNYGGQFDATLGKLGLRGLVDFDYLERSDHLLTQPHAQQQFIESVLRWMAKRQLLAHAQTT